jgi:hypothetical protein
MSTNMEQSWDQEFDFSAPPFTNTPNTVFNGEKTVDTAVPMAWCLTDNQNGTLTASMMGSLTICLQSQSLITKPLKAFKIGYIHLKQVILKTFLAGMHIWGN